MRQTWRMKTRSIILAFGFYFQVMISDDGSLATYVHRSLDCIIHTRCLTFFMSDIVRWNFGLNSETSGDEIELVLIDERTSHTIRVHSNNFIGRIDFHY